MPPKTHVLDGLWYLLRPSLVSTAPSRSFHTWSPSKRNPQRPTRTASISRPQAQCYSDTARTGGHGASNPSAAGSGFSDLLVEQEDSAQSNEHGDRLRHTSETALNATGPSRKQIRAKRLNLYHRIVSRLEKKETSFLEAKLEEIATKAPDVRDAVYVLHVLVGQRHIRPAASHYRALILANRDPKHGSADQVRALLAEMEPNAIAVGSATLHAALQALAVHPDYLLREDIKQTLRDRWLSLSPDGWHWVVAGLVRENQFELALDHIAQMRIKGIPVKNWLHGLIVYNLCEIEDFDEVLRQMDSRVRQGYDMSQHLWHYVLDVASEALHRRLTRFAWMRMVELGYLRPAYGTCRNTLIAAGREGDVQLAASVFRYLEDIGIPPGREDYESMAEAHLMSGNLYSAFEMLCTMHKSGIGLEGSSTRSVLTYMAATKTTPRTAWNILKQLKLSEFDIHVDCANVVLELCERKALNDPTTVDEAIAFYKELYALCASGANATTYETLVSMCRRAVRRDAAMFVIKEMSALNIVPNDQVFEDIIMMCLERNNFQSAFHYFQDLVERGGHLTDEATIQIRSTCSASPDRFAAELRSHPLIRCDRKRRDKGIDKPRRSQDVSQMPLSGNPVTSSRRRRRRQGVDAFEPARHNVRRARRRLQASRETRITANKERRRRKRRVEAFKRRAGTKSWADCKMSDGQGAANKDSTGSASTGSKGPTDSRDQESSQG